MRIEREGFIIRPMREDELDAALTVYQQCADFLALTPQPTASKEMVQSDMALSRASGGVFCGIYDWAGMMVGVVDVVLKGFKSDPHTAFIDLLMIGQSHRENGLGSAVVAAVEAEIRLDKAIQYIRSGVMVNNPAAIRFWQRHGYRIVSEPTPMPDGTTVYALQKDVNTIE